MRKNDLLCLAGRMAAVAAVFLTMSMQMSAQEFVKIPASWKWLDNEKVAFSYDGSFTDSQAFAVRASSRKTIHGIKAPAKYSTFPADPEGAVNRTWAPDSSAFAFTRNNDLYVYDVASATEKRLTFDGNELILNGYASWVYRSRTG